MALKSKSVDAKTKETGFPKLQKSYKGNIFLMSSYDSGILVVLGVQAGYNQYVGMYQQGNFHNAGMTDYVGSVTLSNE